MQKVDLGNPLYPLYLSIEYTCRESIYIKVIESYLTKSLVSYNNSLWKFADRDNLSCSLYFTWKDNYSHNSITIEEKEITFFKLLL